ncbi:hypothetical protein GLOIN_2v1673942 [Rhizophagus irregularis DAOM 181602=DAOM 197198]|nr:hypothetical protein GLOIN_2v1673942 [Rhizophagus irregularis DAOM 181602=DAOM 197198]
MSGNYAKRGRGSHNPNSRKASRQDRKNNNNSNNSSSDGENTIQQKRNRTFTENSMEENYMDAAMEQTVSLQGKVLVWSSLNNTNKLCHRCGKLGCAPNFCPLKQTRGCSRTCNPVAKLKERFNVNQPRHSNSNAANTHDNNNNNNHKRPNPNTFQRVQHNSKERSVSFSSSSCSTARSLPLRLLAKT